MKETLIPAVENKELTKKLNNNISILIKEFTKIALADFSSVKNIIKITLKQKNSEKKRNYYEEQNIHVPPFLIASITKSCNLKCKGCYDQQKPTASGIELTANDWSNIFVQARDLGISFILLAGGEPLLKKQLLKDCINYPEIIFPMFTNGLLINDEWVNYFALSRNIVPIVSIEGDKTLTNNRRGKGVYEVVIANLDLLKKKRIFYGISLTLTTENYIKVLSEEYIQQFINKGCRVFMYIEYIPFDPTTENLVINESQRINLNNRLNYLREKFNAIFIAFPGDEADFGGCLAAGRGFMHLNAMGDVEACPFAPYSDINLKNVSLKEALNSRMLANIRDTHALLEEHNGGCSLFENKELIERILFKSR
ncbi:radical SAM protein [Clostridium sp. 'deep sea']|uniref:radical SAM/SPASM domain-containing protein n=1 Tax=Clostridium sp. 'deep sea' TaxID=2779445 RepID=UPI0018966952|nr:radical SAM protein [Clostridium sp. 'deep sea']QOR36158.1 radical SAM protein [Clostridium sp. 'deep sea']